MKKIEYGYATYYIRSSVLGGQVLSELDNSGSWSRGYVYAGSTMMAVQQYGGVFWQYEDAVTKSKRTTDINGNIVSVIETDPWGADTNRSSYAAFQPRKFTSYDRDGNGSDEAMFRRYNRKHSHFDQPDPYDGSYDVSDPQSFNRYAYVENDPVSLIDRTGLMGDFPEAYWGFGHFENGFWGSGYLSGDGWGSDPHPGLRIIQATEERFDRYYWNRGHNWGNREGHLRGWSSDFDSPNFSPLLPQNPATECPPVQFKVTGIAPGQAPYTTAISETPRANIPDGDVAIKPRNFGVKGINGNNRDVFLNMRLRVDWSTAGPAGAPPGIPTEGPFRPADVVGPASVRNSPGNLIDVYNYSSKKDAWASTRTVMVTAVIPVNKSGVKCPEGN